MTYRTSLEIKTEILGRLKVRPHAISQLEHEVRTSDRVIKRHLKELEQLGHVEVVSYKRHPRTGRPFRVARQTGRSRRTSHSPERT